MNEWGPEKRRSECRRDSGDGDGTARNAEDAAADRPARRKKIQIQFPMQSSIAPDWSSLLTGRCVYDVILITIGRGLAEVITSQWLIAICTW